MDTHLSVWTVSFLGERFLSGVAFLYSVITRAATGAGKGLWNVPDLPAGLLRFIEQEQPRLFTCFFLIRVRR